MKHILYWLIGIVCLTGCSEADDVATGYLDIVSLDVKSAISVDGVASRTTEEPLTVAIYNSAGVAVYEFTSETINKRLILDAGSYKIVAQSSNYSATYETNNLGEPKYYAEQTFEIVLGEVTSVRLQVPMVNVGIRFEMYEGYETWFKSAHLIVNSVSLNPGEIGYVDEADISATIYMTNVDDESNVKQYSFTATPGTIYTIKYSL